MKQCALAFIVLLALGGIARAANPILPGIGLADPEARVYNNHVYLYATHDAIPGSKSFVMRDWWVWTSDDLLNWRKVSTLRPEDTYYDRPYASCWATNAISHNGQYYFYFSRGRNELGVVEGDTPAGRWHDPISKPLIASGSVPTMARDPGILQEKDGTTYIIFGCWNYYIARLNDDMVSLAEKPRPVVVNHKMGPYGPGKLDDKPILFKRGGIYYLSWGCYYATASNVYGPYTYKDCIIKKDRVEPIFRNGLTFDRHGSFFELYHQWYFICNDQSWPGTTAHYRDSVISYVHFQHNGDIDPIYLNRLGVGEYDAAQVIPAANYFALDGGQQRQNPAGGFEVVDLKSGSTINYPHVMDVPENATITLRAASKPGCRIEFRAINVPQRFLGSCSIPPGADGSHFTDVSCKLTNAAGIVNLRLFVRGGNGELLRLQSLGFHKTNHHITKEN